MILAVALSPFTAIFVNSEGYLPRCFAWLTTPDNPSIGDQSYGNNEMAWTATYPRWISYYIRCVSWNCRNPALGFSYVAGLTVGNDFSYSVSGNERVDIGVWGATFGSVKRHLVNDGKTYFDYKWVWQWNSGYGAMFRMGWNLEPTLIAGLRRALVIDFRPRIKLP
jgi:hypothetical protein